MNVDFLKKQYADENICSDSFSSLAVQCLQSKYFSDKSNYNIYQIDLDFNEHII